MSTGLSRCRSVTPTTNTVRPVIGASTGCWLRLDRPWSPKTRTNPKNSQAAGRFTLTCGGEGALEDAACTCLEAHSSALPKSWLCVTVATGPDPQRRRPMQARSSSPASIDISSGRKLIDTPLSKD